MTDSTVATAAECPRHAGEPMPCGHCAMDAADCDSCDLESEGKRA